MKRDNLIQIKSYDFSVKVVLAFKELMNERKEFILSKQLMRSGTSIGANVEEAIGGFSKKDFYFKLTISYKEARESLYWIRLLFDTGYLSQEDKNKLIKDCEEILKIIGSILKTLRKDN
jgi:four helix bundle protein